MPDTVDDFLNRFGRSSTIDDREAARYYDRFASTDPADRDFDNNALYEGTTEYLGKLPDNDFQQAAQGAFSRAQPLEKQTLLQGLLRGL